MSTATTTTTFEVSNVEPATEPLPEVPYKHAVEAQITPAKPLSFRVDSDRKLRQIYGRTYQKHSPHARSNAAPDTTVGYWNGLRTIRW